jgi:hypothetical protein
VPEQERSGLRCTVKLPHRGLCSCRAHSSRCRRCCTCRPPTAALHSTHTPFPTHLEPQCPDGIFAALAVHLAHKARGQPVEFRPNTVYAPLTLDALQLQARGGCVGLGGQGGVTRSAQLAG